MLHSGGAGGAVGFRATGELSAHCGSGDAVSQMGRREAPAATGPPALYPGSVYRLHGSVSRERGALLRPGGTGAVRRAAGNADRQQCRPRWRLYRTGPRAGPGHRLAARAVAAACDRRGRPLLQGPRRALQRCAARAAHAGYACRLHRPAGRRIPLSQSHLLQWPLPTEFERRVQRTGGALQPTRRSATSAI